jgi:hypothetical protein
MAMDKLQYVKLVELFSRSQADLLESYLEAYGVDVELIQESVAESSYSSAYHRIQVFVPRDMFQQARELLKSFDIEKEDGEE